MQEIMDMDRIVNGMLKDVDSAVNAEFQWLCHIVLDFVDITDIQHTGINLSNVVWRVLEKQGLLSKMLEQALELQVAIDIQTQEDNIFGGLILELSWMQSTELVAIAKLLEEVVPLFKALLYHFEDQKDPYATLNDILDADFANAHTKIKEYYNKTNWIYCVKMALDPQFGLWYFVDEEWPDCLVYQLKMKMSLIFNSWYKSVGDAQIDTGMVERNELDEYWALERKDQEHAITLGIPAMSVLLEQLFSAAGEVMTAQRNCLAGDKAQAIMLLSDSWSLAWLCFRL
ncbi:hypothetical protein M427DRAFT_35637 [Gonapodya prolifera JEL478]|uniref:HAT C-terminal dimerisation domain-containing protein n=1 Tax=Gonapodya prolifera (strain JEL478) TaxID=1344416 RepID=A0A139A3V0_GONPJ|nr:hypothetical protein M427DRAFT_35637 [Gonapodya prolifera JEL478]|eukprot:KXS11497.1 hypothetical protein M427DRAFT_35637 [Gonapodya prolifera JEL478]